MRFAVQNNVAYLKTCDRMAREVNRALSNVKMLDKLYREMVESKTKENK